MMHGNMRIGIVTHNYSDTPHDKKNAGIFVADFARSLKKKIPVSVFTIHIPRQLTQQSHILNPMALFQLKKLIDQQTDACTRFVDANNIEFLVAMWAIPGGLIAERIKKKRNIPYAVWSLGSDINIYSNIWIVRNIIKKSLTSADVLFANSMTLSDKVTALSNKTCHFLPAVTNFELKKIKPKKLSDTIFHFLFVGRLEKIKGPDLLIKAARILKKQPKPFMIHIIGEGAQRKKLEHMVKSYSLQKNILFVGESRREKVASYMLGCDTIVIPSRSESLPLVLLESYKARLPIIATDVGDCKRMIMAFGNGIVVDAITSESIAHSMMALMKKMISKPKKNISSYTMGKTVSKFLKLIP